LSARALDILIALLSRPNEVVSKNELLAQVWPDVTVEEGSLRFHIAGLRRALGDGRDGARFVETLPGRGYCFVAPVLRWSDQAEEPVTPAGFPHASVPVRLIGMVGRDDDVLKLSTLLTAARFVTIVGAGGIGKTTPRPPTRSSPASPAFVKGSPTQPTMWGSRTTFHFAAP
jgi:DNA-binding winged helix-turn-helix (wHTH) protein